MPFSQISWVLNYRRIKFLIFNLLFQKTYFLEYIILMNIFYSLQKVSLTSCFCFLWLHRLKFQSPWVISLLVFQIRDVADIRMSIRNCGASASLWTSAFTLIIANVHVVQIVTRMTMVNCKRCLPAMSGNLWTICYCLSFDFVSQS